MGVSEGQVVVQAGAGHGMELMVLSDSLARRVCGDWMLKSLVPTCDHQ